jgi:dTDP-4-dehydrorhamnose reductase
VPGRLVVIGASGQLGSDVLRACADLDPAGVDHALIELEDPSSIAALIARFRPATIVNAAAFHNVERCETQPARAFAVNAVAVENLAAQCANAGIALVHISTDYVFDGNAAEPYAETDPTGPLNVYGISKLAGELAVRARAPAHYIVRTSGLYGRRGSSTKGYTFIERMLGEAERGRPVRVVDDVVSSPSYTLHVAGGVRAILERGEFGTYHITNAGACSWYDFAAEIFRQAGLKADLSAVGSDAFPAYARRPRFSALRNTALERLNLPALPGWRDGIAAYLHERALT